MNGRFKMKYLFIIFGICIFMLLLLDLLLKEKIFLVCINKKYNKVIRLDCGLSIDGC